MPQSLNDSDLVFTPSESYTTTPMISHQHTLVKYKLDGCHINLSLKGLNVLVSPHSLRILQLWVPFMLGKTIGFVLVTP